MDSKDKKVEHITGKIVAIDFDKRGMLVRNEAKQEEYPLHWQAVMDDVLRKQKVGYRVKIDLTTYPNDPQPYVTAIGYDDTYKKKHDGAYALNSNEILIQNLLRTGAMVFAVTTTPDSMDFDKAMEMLINRAVADAHTVKTKAKELDKA